MRTAVVLRVPELDELGVGPDAVPAHVVLMDPFLPPEELDEGVVAELEWFFAGVDGFRLRFARVDQGPDGVWLVAQPDRDLRELTKALVRRWPEAEPPLDLSAPRLRLLHDGDEATRTRVCERAAALVPMTVVITSAALREQLETGWHERAAFELGEPER